MVSRAGWGFGSVNEEGGFTRGIYGNVPGFLPQSSLVKFMRSGLASRTSSQIRRTTLTGPSI
eukprot:8665232-Pyramimonas_sp.AAC.1